MSQPTPLYLEDLSPGQTFRTATVSVGKDRLKTFAAEFDPQPFHLDETAAASSLFGGLVASGWHTAAMTMRLMVESDFRIVGGLIGVGVEQIRWPHPVRAGDVLHVECEVLETRPSRSSPDRGLVRFKSATRNQEGAIVMEQTAVLMVPRDPRRSTQP
jgi:acyl dehydratase